MMGRVIIWMVATGSEARNMSSLLLREVDDGILMNGSLRCECHPGEW